MRQIRSKIDTLYIDLAFCFIFLPLVIYAFPVERWWGTYPLFFSLFILWLYITYFIYRYLVIPRLFQKGRARLMALIAIILSLAVTFAFSSYEITSPFYHINRLQRESYPYPIWGIRQNQQAIWLHYIIVVFFCFAVGMLEEAYRQRLARSEVENERNKAELALYKAQINPHFIFNTLNTIYGLLITRSDKTEASMERFITLAKYMYSNAEKEYISLAEELDYLEQYIALQQLRLNDLADVRFSHDLQRGDLQIAPMLLITFVENSFKYGISSDYPCFVHISLNQRDDELVFEAVNSTFGREVKGSSHMGIRNCRRRLELLYPGRHNLETGQDKDGTFRVRLTIKLGEKV